MNSYRLSITACAFLALALCAPFAGAQSTSLDIEAGYQEVDVNGNEDMFRTQINQQDGFVLRNFSINFVDPTGDAGFVDGVVGDVIVGQPFEQRSHDVVVTN